MTPGSGGTPFQGRLDSPLSRSSLPHPLLESPALPPNLVFSFFQKPNNSCVWFPHLCLISEGPRMSSARAGPEHRLLLFPPKVPFRQSQDGAWTQKMWAGPSEAVPLKPGEVMSGPPGGTMYLESRTILVPASSQPLEGRRSGFWIDVRAKWLRILAWRGYKLSRAPLIHASLGSLLWILTQAW